MCNRYSNTKEVKLRIGNFEITVNVKSRRYNIAPRQVVPVVAPWKNGTQFGAVEMTWGWEVPWSKGAQTLAKAETIMDKEAFRPHLNQRCLVPADGFYEFIGPKTEKTPIRFTKPDEDPFFMAGLYRPSTGPDAAAGEFLLLTTGPNESVAKYHERMPLIVKPALYEAWFDNARFPSVLADPDHGELRGYAVSRALNSWRNEGEDLIKAVEQQRELF